MNKNLYRLIFNTVRGMYIAVQEFASSDGKRNSRQRTQSAFSSVGACLDQAAVPHVKPEGCQIHVSGILLVAAMLPYAIGAVAHSQIIADPAAPGKQRPTILNTADKKPLVNIQTPSEAGVSRNIYRQFDVQTNGAVLNNQRSSNPWLAKGEARIILNEVRSSKPSYLQGPLSVQGSRAEVIIANPSGITVDGGSFINMQRVTLATGTPIIKNGELNSLLVERGVVNIQDKGLDVTDTSYTEILARAVKVLGNIQAGDKGALSITTGAYAMGYPERTLEPTAGADTTPAIAIDTAALGGMYAHRIQLFASEQGVGVRNSGTLKAYGTDSQLIVTAAGKLENSGTMDALVTSAASLGGNLDNTGRLRGQEVLVVSSGNDLNLSGTGLSQDGGSSNVMLHANRDINMSSKSSITSIGDGKADDPDPGVRISVSTGRTLSIAADSTIEAHGTIHLNSEGSINMEQAALYSRSGNVVALSSTGIHADKLQVSGNTVHLEAGAPFQETTANIHITGGSLHAVRQTNLIATGNLLIGSKDSTPETPIDGRGSLHMEAGQNLEIAAGAHIKTKGDLIALAGSALVLRAQEGSSSSKIARLTSQKTILLHGEALRLHGSQAKAKDSLTLSSLGGDIKLEPIIAKGNLQPTRLQAGKELTVAAYEGNIDAHALHTDSKSLILLGAENVKIQSSPKVAAGPLKNRLLAKTNAHVGSLSKNLLVDNTEISTLVGNINLHAADSAAMSTTNLNAGKNLTLASSGSLLIEDSTLNADGFLNLSSAGNQKIRTSKLTSGAASLYVNKGVLELDQITLSTKPPTTASLGRVSGQINIESSGPIVVDGNAQSSMRSKFSAHTDLTILAGEGPITLTPEDAAQTGTGLRLSSSQIAARRSLSIATRKGPLTLLGIAGEHGNPSARSVELSAKGDISLGGATVDIQGATVRSGANLSVTSYSGSLLIDGIRNNFTSYRPAHRIQTLKENIASVTAQHAALLNNPEYAELNAQVDKFWKDLGPACWFWYHYGDDICRSPPLHKLEPILAKRDLFEAPMGALYKEKLELEKTLATLDSDAQGYEHLGAKLSARNIHLMSANGIAIHGADISASQTAEIKASGNLPGNTTTAAEQEASAGIRITGLSDFYEYGSPRSNKHAWAVISTPTRIIGNKNVIVQSAGSGAPADLVINDTEVASLSGSISLQSFSNIFLESGQEEFYSYSQRRYRRGNWFKRRRITETRINQEATASPVILNGGTIAIKSGGSVHAQATEFSAPKGGITLTAANALSLYAVPEVSYEKVDVRRRSSVLGVSTSRRKSTTTREAATQLPTTLVASSAQTSSGWNTLLQGTIFETSLKGADIKVGVGDQARSDARIVLEGIKQRVAERQTKEGNYVVWQRSLDAGSISESLAMPKFTGPTPPSFHGPISANIPNGHFKAELKALINQPGYAYLGTLAKRDDINWQPVTLAYKTWRESQKGLTPAGATLLAAAVSWATHGAGSELMNSVTGHSVNSMASKMASAAFTSLSAQAAVSLINNQGDISKTLKALANSDIARAALATAITAGAMAHVTELSGIQDIAGGSAVTNRLAFNLINAGGHALSYAAINGDDLKDALRAGVIGGLVNTAHGEITRSYIKNLQNAHIADQMLHKIAHAVAGCAAGAVAGNSCRDGAIGATAAEMVAELFMDDFPSLEAPTAQWEAFHNKVKTYGKLVAGSIAAYIGGNPQTAITAAEVAYDNNGRLTIRMRAEQLRLSPQQYYFNSYGANLMKSILAKGGRAPDRMIAPNATVRFTRRDVEELAEILRKLDPDSHLILRVPTQLRSPLPDTYMYIQWGLNSDILASARDVTAFGFKRDGNAYFLELLARYPQLFSPRNAIRIKDGMAPTIDLQWVRHNPSHISFIGETLVHHHWMQGPLIVPLPRPIHNSWSRYLHPYQ